MPGREKEENPSLKFKYRMETRSVRFKLQGMDIDKERVNVVRHDLKLFDVYFKGPCTARLDGRAPVVIYRGEVWVTGMSAGDYETGLHRSGRQLRKMTDKEVIEFWENFFGENIQVKPGFKIKGFQKPLSFNSKK